MSKILGLEWSSSLPSLSVPGHGTLIITTVHYHIPMPHSITTHNFHMRLLHRTTDHVPRKLLGFNVKLVLSIIDSILVVSGTVAGSIRFRHVHYWTICPQFDNIIFLVVSGEEALNLFLNPMTVSNNFH